MNANGSEAPAHDSNVLQSQIFAQLSEQSHLLAQLRCILRTARVSSASLVGVSSELFPEP
jgi:hypothetical protein